MLIPYDKLNGAIEAMDIAGLIVTTDNINHAVEGKLYRVCTKDKPKDKDGWFKVLYDSVLEFVTICYGSWRDSTSLKYHISLKSSTLYKKMSRAEYVALQTRVNARIEADRLKRNQEIKQKRDYYVNEYSKFANCCSHDYLTRKGIKYQQHYQLKVDDRFNRNLLCVPFINSNGVLQGYQSIAVDGTKRFNGSVGGYYWQYPISNPCPGVFDKKNTFYILCEGLATGLSVYEAITMYFDTSVFLPIILCAFNVGNLDKVISATKSHNRPYLLLVDNDSNKTRNAGIEMAKKLLANHSDSLICPLTFSDGNDANDYILKHGVEQFTDLMSKYANPIINKLKR